MKDLRSWLAARMSGRRELSWSRVNLIAACWVPLTALALVIAWATIYTPYDNGPAIRSDGAGYHAWTRALVDRDLSFCRWKDAPESFVSIRNTKRGFCLNKYPPGLALLRFPVMAFLVDHSDFNKLSITPEEHQASLIIGGVLLWLTCALMVWAAALLELAPWRSSIAVLMATFGTGLFHYGTYDNTFSHAYSAFFTAVLLFLAVREHATQRPMNAVALAVCVFFLFSMRNTNVFLLAECVVAYVIWYRSQPPLTLFKRVLLPLGIGAGLAMGFQLALNYYANGSFLISSYGEEGFEWNRPMQREVLFSFERGVFLYYPMFGVGVVCGLLSKRARKPALLLLALILTYAVVYGYWHSWQLSAGFGHRGFVELVPVIPWVLCLAWDRWRGPALAAAMIAGILGTSVTLQIMYAYWQGDYKQDGEPHDRYYWDKMQVFESFAVGGTMCRPRRCDPLEWKCTTQTMPDYKICLEGITRVGFCNQGDCAPVIALRQVAGNAGYVTSLPMRKNKGRPLEVGTSELGAQEKYLLFRSAQDRTKFRLMSLAHRRYVTAPETDGEPGWLTLAAEEPTEHDTFKRVGSRRNFALKSWNDRFVTLVANKGRRSLLRATADGVADSERFALEYVHP